MLSTLAVVLPIFALIFAGWAARRIGVLGPHATTELNRFVVYLALPALLFDIVAHARWVDVWQPGFVGAFGLGAAAVFGLTYVVQRRRSRHPADAAIDGLNASYANTGFLGFPLVLVALGREGLAPTMIATIITVCFLFAVAIVLIELGLQDEASGRQMALALGARLLRNPLLVAPGLGAIVPLAGLGVPAPAETFLKLLGAAASPCALVALGLFLAQRREPAPSGDRADDRADDREDDRSAALLVAFKLVLHPAVTWVLATAVFGLLPLATHAAVLLAALPTGTGPFMLAQVYRREGAVTSTVVLVSTIVSVMTVSLYLALAT